MNKTVLISIIIVILLVGIGGYFIYNANQSPTSQTMAPGVSNTAPTANLPASAPVASPSITTPITPPITPPPTPVTNNQPLNLTSAITIQNFSFNPAVLTVKEGTTVVWTNQDPVPHKIKSDTFNSAALNKGENFQFTFSTAGVYNYSCAIHPSMTGKIIVTK